MAAINKLFILLSAFLLLINSANAASFGVKVTAVKDLIVVDEVAEFDVEVQNGLGAEQEFLIKKAGYPFWDMYTKPLQNPITLKVPALSTASLRLFVDPLYITNVDTYTLDVGVVLQSTGEEVKAPVTIGIKSIEPLIQGYVPTVLTSASLLPEEIDPRDEFKVTIFLNNQNVLDYPNLTIKLDSSLFKDEMHYPLGPKEDKIIEVTKKLDAMTPPQKENLVITVFRGERLIISPIVKKFEVKPYLIQEDIPKEQSFLRIRKGIKVVSNDINYKGAIKIETTPFKNLLLTASPRAKTIKENGKQYLIWDIELDKNRAMKVYTTENYRPIVVIIALAIAAVVLYFIFRSPIVVRKGVANVGMNEGGISEVKVFIRVKNRSGKPIRDIEVVDNVPHIAHVEKELSVGSMQPHAILQHPKRGIIIKWNVESIEPGDERVLSYKMKSRLAILGEFNLPAANARCKANDKVVISNSNRVSVGG